MSDEVWTRWCQAFDAARQEIQNLFFARYMWRAIRGMLENPELTVYTSVSWYLQTTYVSTICSALRRELDSDARTTSLARCLVVLTEDPSIISRTRFRELAMAEHPDYTGADESFDQFADPGSELLDIARVQASLDSLNSVSQPIRRYVNRAIAHRESGDPPSVSWEQLNAALFELGKVYAHYYQLRDPGVSLGSVTPVVDYTFYNTFKQPWYHEGIVPPTLDDPLGFN